MSLHLEKLCVYTYSIKNRIFLSVVVQLLIWHIIRQWPLNIEENQVSCVIVLHSLMVVNCPRNSSLLTQPNFHCRVRSGAVLDPTLSHLFLVHTSDIVL